MSKSQISACLEEQASLMRSLEDYVYGLANRGNPNELEFLFQKMPSLMAHGARRPSPIRAGDWRFLSVPWAIFADRTEYDDRARECLLVLERAGYQPNAHFIERMVWKAWPTMVRDYCEFFKVSSTHTGGDDPSLLWMAAGHIDSPSGLEVFQQALRYAENVNSECGKYPKPVLMSLFTSSLPLSATAGPDALTNVLRAIDLMLGAGANPDASGVMNGWAHNHGDGERLPILHAVYWADYTGRSCPSLVSKAEQVCDPSVTDYAGRTAMQYKRFLVDSQAHK
ncbi:MAG: hypothetical protein AWU57_1630 [Marinobacter sp. T13-3]|nr:MAG: hypothetical protein AWU57_1630 [Marinobacter sp. T13-3]